MFFDGAKGMVAFYTIIDRYGAKRAKHATSDVGVVGPTTQSGRRESNPRVQLGKLAGYHYITPAEDSINHTLVPDR